jgi:hypothetical protein
MLKTSATSQKNGKGIVKVLKSTKINKPNKSGVGTGNNTSTNTGTGTNNNYDKTVLIIKDEPAQSPIDKQEPNNEHDSDMDVDIEFEADDTPQRENNLDTDELEDMDRMLLKAREENIAVLSPSRPSQSQKHTQSSHVHTHSQQEKKTKIVPRKNTSLLRGKLKASEYSNINHDDDPESEVENTDNEHDHEHEHDYDTESKHASNDDNHDEHPTVVIKKPRKKTVPKKTPVRKGPGRPRKTPKKEPIPRKGTTNKPINEDSVVEFLYDMPLVMKKIVAFFKSLAAAQIQIIFRPTDIIMYAQDHHKKSKIRVRIDGSKLNQYYCKSILDIGISSKELESILNTVDKDYSSIILVSTAGNTQKNLIAILENDIQIDETHTIDLIGQYNHMDNEEEFTDENYMIQFEWPGKYFRKTINDIKTISTQISISQEDCESPLELCYTSSNKKIHSRHIVKNADKIKLRSQLSGDDTFHVDIKVDYIKPISSAHIADEIMILVDENKKFMTKAYIDNRTIEIKTLTEIIDERPDNE